MMTLGSLFDGSGGFPLGGLLAGITPVWASEIEPFPIRVTTKRLPFMKHYGNVSEMDGGKVEPVDIITFGSPCQDMSVAGKRAGLEGSRSNLFYEAVRIIKEMRKATGGEYPKWACWENVPGAFSSSGGEDFRCVLESLCGVIDESVSIPKPKKWANAGEVLGDGYSLAWRVLDAQFWGVPQRRKRIYLVADFTGGCAGKVLFESEGLSGYSPQGFRSWQTAPGDSANCAGTAGIGFDGYNGSVTDDKSATLSCNNDQTLFEPCSWDGGQISPTLTKQNAGGGQRMPDKDNFNCVLQPFGICSKDSNAMKSSSPHSGVYEADTSRTIDTSGGNPACNQGGIAVVCVDQGGGKSSCNVFNGLAPTLACTHGGEPVVAFAQNQRDEVRDLGEKSACLSAEPGMKQQTYVLQGNMIGRSDGNGPQGDGINEDVSFTLNTVDRHAVYAMTTGNFSQVTEDAAPTLMARDFKDPTAVCYGIGRDTFNQSKNARFSPTFDEELQPTLVAKGPGAIQSGYTVRRLTPTECARLQGLPDWWCADLGTEKPSDEGLNFWHKVFKTDSEVTGCKMKSDKQIAKWLRDPHSDAAEYKMWGKGVALPCVVFVLSGIVYCTQSEIPFSKIDEVSAGMYKGGKITRAERHAIK